VDLHHYTMQLLRQLGLPPRTPAALEACALYLDEGLAPDGGINFWGPGRRAGETCVTGMILAQLCASGVRDRRIERLTGCSARTGRDGRCPRS
jgi:hypothetical protein